ncbi:MerR family transcriptional regulator [Streptomyces sp. NPDC102360]|uniref:MerR family transcriptional regulator n=1 Tax=Streptomyces sp. NPDC102360 TaxID=3366160 RepID=UPI00382C611E
MRIGELSERTQVPARMLRYYEEQGLITPRRLDNGYRVYDERLVDRVLKIRGLLDAGIPTRIIGDMLPCLNQPQEIVVADPDPQLRAMLERERDRMTERVGCLTDTRDRLSRYIEALERAEAGPGTAPDEAAS